MFNSTLLPGLYAVIAAQKESSIQYGHRKYEIYAPVFSRTLAHAYEYSKNQKDNETEDDDKQIRVNIEKKHIWLEIKISQRPMLTDSWA